MEFGMEKWVMLIMKNGKRQISEGTELLNREGIKAVGEKEIYKYLWILETDTIKQAEMKK